MSSKNGFSEAAAQRYALALFELSQENSEIQEIEVGAENVKKLLYKNFEFQSLIKDPTLKKNEQMLAMQAISNHFNFNKTFSKFLLFLCSKRRLFFLERILINFLRLVAKSRGEIKAELNSSKELTKLEIESIRKELSESFTSKINLHYKYDPALIGGLLIQVGSVMIDTSIKNKLKQLETSMVEA